MSPECNLNYCFKLDPEVIEKVFAVRRLDPIHQAAMLALYTLDAQGLYDDYPRHLHLFLLCKEEGCAPVLDVLVDCGLLRRAGEKVELVHRPKDYPRAKGTLEVLAETCGQTVEEFNKDVEGRKADYSYSRPVPKLCADTGIGG